MSKCKAITAKKKRCSRNAKDGTKFCRIHQDGYEGGRPTDYRIEFNEQAYKLTLLGATDAELADFFKVSEQTIDTWKKKKPKFLESVMAGKEIADGEVAHSFYKRALGYEFEELRQEAEHGVMIKVVKTKKHIPADSGAALNWLKNRQPKRWRDKAELDISAVLGSYDMSQLTDQQLQRIANGEHPSAVLADGGESSTGA